jgi:hypothetical protein
VIHVGTLHYRDPRWIELQLRYLAAHTGEPYRTYASLDGIERRHFSRFDETVDHSGFETGERPGARIELKLNALCSQMTGDAGADDLIVVAHGDTLPIADWVSAVRPMVAGSGLAAIRRDENLEPIPHWSFCATTAGLWERIGGDWTRGPTWESAGLQVTDTGGRLWKILEREGVDWRPILRTNAVDLHPVWFGIYGDFLYHHGAGFRTPMSRKDAAGYAHLPPGLRNLAGVRKRISNTRLSRRMYRGALRDERFYEPLMSPR